VDRYSGADAVITRKNAMEPEGAIGRTRGGEHESYTMNDVFQVQSHLNAHWTGKQRRSRRIANARAIGFMNDPPIFH
jgi:hypothetical protein